MEILSHELLREQLIFFSTMSRYEIGLLTMDYNKILTDPEPSPITPVLT